MPPLTSSKSVVENFVENDRSDREPPVSETDDWYAEVAHAAPIASTSKLPRPLTSDWSDLIERLHVRGLEKQLAQQSELIDFNDKTIELRCESRMLAHSPVAILALEKRLNAHFKDHQRSLKVQQGNVQATPAIEKAQVRANELQGAQKLIAENSTISDLIQEFDGMLVPSSIQAT